MKAFIICLIIDHYPEKLKNPRLVEAALLLPKYSHHRLIAERYINPKNSENKTVYSIEQIQLLFSTLKKKKQILHNADETTFINICLGIEIPFEKRIKWTGSRKNCFSFMMDLRGNNIKANEVNRSFQQWRVNAKGVINSKDLQRNDQTNAIPILSKIELKDIK